MSHKTLIGGTAYNITGGKTLVGGTAYSISKGRTQVGGTDYDISFSPTPYAMLYTDGNMVFQYGSSVESGKTLRKSYKGFEDAEYSSYSSIPWYSNRMYINNVNFKDVISPFSMSYWFYNSINLTTFNHLNLDLNSITNMSHTYYNCTNLTGAPVCGNNVMNMSGAYYNCTNITGRPVCGNNVTDMGRTYTNCKNLTGSPVCGDNVTNISITYSNCYGLTGRPVCGNNVTSMGLAYANCYNLTGSPVCGNNVTDMYQSYLNCSKLHGNAYFCSNNVTRIQNCFRGRSTSNRLNIYVNNGSNTMNTCLYNNSYSLVGTRITWTNNGTCYYNISYNIYIYPVSNVSELLEAEKAKVRNMLIDFTYTENDDGTFTIIDWKKTLNGIPSTECIIPEHELIQ